MTNEKVMEILTVVKDEYLHRGTSWDDKAAKAVEYAMEIINENAELKTEIECLKADISAQAYQINNQAGQINAYRYCLECMGRGKDQDSEKQIPKKPDYEGDGYDENGNLIYDTWICPSCESKYEVDYDEYEHCPKCGQALDWRDEI